MGWQRLPWKRWWLCDNISTLRLQRRFRKLVSWVERREEGVVLQECRQGLPTSGRRMRLSRAQCEQRDERAQLQHAGAFASSSGVCGAIRLSRSLPRNRRHVAFCWAAAHQRPADALEQVKV